VEVWSDDGSHTVEDQSTVYSTLTRAGPKRVKKAYKELQAALPLKQVRESSGIVS